MAAKGKSKTKTQLLSELEELRKRMAELEAAKTGPSDSDERLRRANRTLDAIRVIAGLTSKDKEQDIILRGVCDGLVETQGYAGAWVGVLDEAGVAKIVVSASFRALGEQMVRDGLPECVRQTLAQPQLVVIEDPSTVCGHCPALASHGENGLLSVRLEWGGKTLGLLAVYAARSVIQDWQEQTLFQELARHLAFGLTNIALKHSVRVLDTKSRIAEFFMTLPDDRMYREVLNVLLEVTRSPQGVFGYLDETGAYVVPNVPRSAEDPGDGTPLVFPVDTWGNAAGQRALREKRSIWSNEASTDAPEPILPVRRQISVPVIHEGEVLGLIQVVNKESDYSAADIELLENTARDLAPALSERLHRARDVRAQARADEAQRAARQELEAFLRKQAEELGRVRKSLQDVSAVRTRAEERSRRHKLLSQSVGLVFQDTLACQDDEEVARVCLGHAQRLTDSAYGYFARVNPKGRFDVMALAAPDGEVRMPADADPVARVENVEIRGVWGKVLRGGESQIINDPSASSGDRVGMPEGSPPLASFISVPVRLSGTIVGAIALANRPGGYDETDLDLMEGLSRLFAEALRLHRAEMALRDARREVARRDSLALLGQLAGDVESAPPLKKVAPPRRKLFSWLNGRGAERPGADNGASKAAGARHCSVLIASSRPAFQEAVRGALVSQERISVLDSADLDEEGILNAKGTHPDVIVVDLSAAGMSGFRTITKIREQLPEARVIAVSPYATKSIRYTARESGAHRLLLGDFQGRDLVDAIRGLMAAL